MDTQINPQNEMNFFQSNSISSPVQSSMLKWTTIFYVLVSLFSCSSSKIAGYQTVANDVANIQLILKKNETFELHFKDLEERPAKTYVFKGKWSASKEKFKLIFKLDKNDLPDIYALFDPTLTDVPSVRILDKRTVEFKSSDKRIYIWGIPCHKMKIEKEKTGK